MNEALLELLQVAAILVIGTYVAAIAFTLIIAPFVWAWGAMQRWTRG